MLRYGRKTTKMLIGRAKRRLMRLRDTYNDERLTTRERKAIRQLQLKLLPESVAFGRRPSSRASSRGIATVTVAPLLGRVASLRAQALLKAVPQSRQDEGEA